MSILLSALENLAVYLERGDVAFTASIDQAAEHLRQSFDALGVDLRDTAQLHAAIMSAAVFYKLLDKPDLEAKFLSLVIPLTRFK